MNDISAALWLRYGQAIAEMSLTGWIGGIALISLLVASLRPWPRRWAHAESLVRWTCLGILLAASLAWAFHLRWISDDAFISFRYARNWVEGHGLVFNPGERVEGYTNFLWTALLAMGIHLGAPPGATSIALGLTSLAVSLLLTARIAKIVSPQRSRGVLPIGAVLIGSSYLFASFGTSGLETMFASTLVLLSLERALASNPLSAGLAGILAVMAHPDHAIFYLSLGIAMVLAGRTEPREEQRRRAILYLIPFAALYVPYFITRWVYYGSLFPNTYYAKSADAFYFSQGYIYLILCVIGAGLVGWIPLILAGVQAKHHQLFGRFLLLATPLYLLYIMKIGGDFMFGRLLVPLLPILAISVEAGARHLLVTGRIRSATLGVTLAGLSVLPIQFLRPNEKLFHVADERTFYPVDTLHPLRIDSPFTHWSDLLLQVFGKGHDGPLLATGCVGIVAYRTRYPMIDVFGLTDPHVARQPIAQRGRPGHEKLASPATLLERGVMLTDQLVYPPEYTKFTEIFPGIIPLHLVGYHRPLVNALREKGWDGFLDMESFLADYSPPSDPARFDCDLWFFETYYFAHHPKEARRKFINRLRDQGSLSISASDLHALPEGLVPSEWIQGDRIDFSQIDPQHWLRRGSAFDPFPADSPPPAQGEVGRRIGPFANSFTEQEGDAATGVVMSPPFPLRGDVITLLVGGGRDLEHLRVGLIVNDREVASATGCGSTVLGRRIWDVTQHRGKQARLLILDQQVQGWGHIVVDEVVQWRRAVP